MTSDDACMALAGVRYCLGRHTYMPSLCCGWLKTKWPDLKEGDRAQIVREINQHIADEEQRDREPVFAIDVETWREFVAWEAGRSALAALEGGEQP